MNDAAHMDNIAISINVDPMLFIDIVACAEERGVDAHTLIKQAILNDLVR